MTYSVLNLNQSIVSCQVLTAAFDLHTDFSGGRSNGLVFPSLEEFSTVCCDPHSHSLHLSAVNEVEVDVSLEFP